MGFEFSAFRVKPKDRGVLIFSVTMKDCDLKTFSAGGPGGQHQNTANTGVRIIEWTANHKCPTWGVS
jgi:protein subunit release factor B